MIPDCLPLKVIFCVVEETDQIAGGRLTDRIGIGVLTRVVPRDLVNEVLAETRRREKRSRLLPAHVVVYFVMAMAIFRDGYEEVMRRLTGGLQFMRAWSQDWSVPTTGPISQARERLGEAPVKMLFEKVAAPLATPGAPGAWLGHRRLMAIDGVKLDAPDTAANLALLGRPGGPARRPFPQVQVLGLGECGTHAVVAAQIGTLGVGERELAGGLLEAMGPDMLVIADRGFFSFEFGPAGALAHPDVDLPEPAQIPFDVVQVQLAHLVDPQPDLGHHAKVKSTNCSRSGSGGAKSRFTRSAGLCWDGSATVVRGFFHPPRRTPAASAANPASALHPGMVSSSIPAANPAARDMYSPGERRADPGWPGPRRASPTGCPPASLSRAARAHAAASSAVIRRQSATIASRSHSHDPGKPSGSGSSSSGSGGSSWPA
jgi:Insertion element 4 transposase N-terminal